MTTASAGERRRYWLSLAALAIVLPAAILMHTRGELAGWLRGATSEPVVVERGVAQNYAGAQWRLAEPTRLPGQLPETTIIFVEFDATIADMERLQNSLPCTAVLTDDQGRRWEPLFLSEAVLRQSRPDAADKPRCGDFAEVAEGSTITMAESFLVPEDARGLTLSLSMAGEQPDRLLFR